MARFVLRLPDIGEDTAEAEIIDWHVHVGDRIEEDQPLLDVMSGNAIVEMISPVCGMVVAIHGEAGRNIAVGAPLVEFEIEGRGGEPDPATPAPAAGAATPATRGLDAARPARTSRNAPLASPAVRRRARELGIPLQHVPGSAAGGRITEQDLEDYAAGGGLAAASWNRCAKRSSVHDTRLVGLRRAIAERAQASTGRIPDFCHVEEFDLTELERLRRDLGKKHGGSRPPLTVLPFFMRAIVSLMPEFPHVNAHFDDDAGVLRSHGGVHIGIMTRTQAGSMVPVVRHSEALDLWGCASELARVTAAARDGTAAREELSGSTITLISLGAPGGISSIPLINHPEVAIIGLNKPVDRPVVRHGQVVIRTLMNVSCAFDHRIVEGHDAARFVQRLRGLIERPAHIFLRRS